MKFSVLKKAFVAGLATIAAVAVLAGCGGGGDQSAKKQFLNIATGGTAGTYYPIGGALAEILNKEIPGMNASAQSTGAT
ncbi:MAG: C4-dicarboxylate ABC transporter substrate-binding protein, partial [Selenomonadaceae bacterium]|nr:C4-dicarboxylate ABC transporter substrate-binding protein [Selenomonadaceae bacterium]